MKSLSKLSVILLSALGCFSPQVVSAFECGSALLQVGWFNASQGKSSHHINIEGLVGDKFKVKKPSDQNVFVGLGYFFNGPQIACTNLQYGVNAFYLAPTKVRGHVIQENLYANLSFQYSRTNYPIYFAARGLINCYSCIDVVLDVGIGPNIIKTSGFKEHSRDHGITIPDHHLFSNKTVVDFSATAGLGCRFSQILGRCSLEIGYRFFYLGQGELRKNNPQLRNSLKTGNSYANALCFTISL